MHVGRIDLAPAIAALGTGATARPLTVGGERDTEAFADLRGHDRSTDDTPLPVHVTGVHRAIVRRGTGEGHRTRCPVRPSSSP